MRTPNILHRFSQPASAKAARSMNLMARIGTTGDIAEWLELHRSLGLPYSTAEWQALPRMWENLLCSGQLKLFLVEDRSKPGGSRIVSCSAAVFVTDEFCEEAQSVKPPFLAIQLVRRYLAGDLPILSPAEIARANAGDGLNLVPCFEGPKRDALLGEGYLSLCEKRSQGFHLAIGGYNIKALLANPIGELAYEEMVDAGAKLRRDYSKLDGGENGAGTVRVLVRLVGLTRKEAEGHPGSYLASLFVNSRPRFYFTGAEQTLLQHALIGEACDDLARSLCLSLWTVKKRWQAIYERVGDVDRELLPPSTANSVQVSSRGAERRRRLLNYLRQHPEELRPQRLTQLRNSLLALFLFVSSQLLTSFA